MAPYSVDVIYYTKVDIEPLSDYFPEGKAGFFKLDPDIMQYEFAHTYVEDKHIVLIFGDFILNEKKSEEYPYRFNFSLFMQMRLSEETSFANPEDVSDVLSAGANYMYSFVREKVNSLTSQMPHGPLLMPVDTFEFGETEPNPL